MQKMSGVDLSFSIAELAALSGKRVAKVRKTEEGILLFKIGAEELLFEPGVRFHLTRQKLAATEAPDGFIACLRKNIEGKTAQTIAQYGTDRIVEIETRSKEKLIFELFRKGNAILVGEDGKIIACLQVDEAGGRRIARYEKYSYPKATTFELKKPQQIGFCVQGNELGEPVSYSCSAEAGGRKFGTFSEMADYYYANVKKESAAEISARGRVAGLEDRLKLQKEALLRLEREKEEAKAAGDAVYQNYEKVEEIVKIASQMKKQGAGEQEIDERLKKSGARLKSGCQIEIS
ncbi:MAG: NFACT family protein [Candidatus Micrarchaeota archaeon]|nr:NFACT family protein [Candidatus Micrarchaeota archaeon]